MSYVQGSWSHRLRACLTDKRVILIDILFHRVRVKPMLSGNLRFVYKMTRLFLIKIINFSCQEKTIFKYEDVL